MTYFAEGLVPDATPRILFNITHGFQARMLLRSQISDTLLARGARLIIVAPNSDEPYFQQEFDHPQITLEPMPRQAGRVEALMANLRQYFLMNPSLGATLNHKNEAYRRRQPKFYWFARAVNSVLGRVTVLRRAYMALEAKLFPGHEFDELLARHRPALVVTGTPGYTLKDVHLLRAARRLGILTATVMLSWDNLTSKGYMGATPDHLLVWSDLMTDEAVRYHGYPSSQIQWCGAAQFDHYHGFGERFDADAWRGAQGIPGDAALLVYGTINPTILPHEIDLLRELVELVNQNRFSRPCYLWIRLHPQVIQGAFKVGVEPFEALAGPRVRVEKPPVRDSALSWDLPKEDAEHLASLMAAANVVITTSSTLSIDAACTDTPIVNIFYDGPEPVDQALSARRFRDYTHYAEILKTGGIAEALSRDELVAAVNRYLANPRLDAEGRQAILRQQFNRLDGKAGIRTAQTLLTLAGAHATDLAPTGGLHSNGAQNGAPATPRGEPLTTQRKPNE